MKTSNILIINNNVPNKIIEDSTKVVSDRVFKDTGLPLKFIFGESNEKLTSITGKNAQGHNVAFVDPAIIMALGSEFETDEKVELNVVCLYYDWRGLNPEPTNPVHSPYYNGFTPIQIPIQFYTDTTVVPNKEYIDSCVHYLLHELCHAFIFLANIKGAGYVDDVHKEMTIEAYIEIIKRLTPHFSAFTTETKDVVVKERPVGVGARGPLVVQIQKLLGLKADGIFGPKTKAAVIAFQKKNKLVADGIVGPKTWEALKKKSK